MNEGVLCMGWMNVKMNENVLILSKLIACDGTNEERDEDIILLLTQV